MNLKSILGVALMLTAGAGCFSEKSRVVLYCAQDKEFADGVLEQFHKQTGLEATPKFDTEADKSVSLYVELVKEKERPRCDVFWNNEPLSTIRLQRQGLLAPYDSPSAAPYPASAKGKDHCWTAFANRARVLLVNTDLVKESDWPKSLLDLTAAKWKGRVAMSRPQFGTSATQAACLFEVLGSEKAKKYYQDLRNNGVQISPGNKQAAEWSGAGRTPAGQEIAVAVTDTDDSLEEIKAGSHVAIIFPDRQEVPGARMGTLFLPNTVAIVRGCPDPDGARKLVDFLLGADMEKQLAEADSHQIPLNPQVKATLPDVIENGRSAHPMAVDFEKAADMWDTVQGFLRDEFRALEETEVDNKILLRVTAPAVVIGLLLFAACLVSVFYVARLQANMTDILTRNVASLQAAQELQIRVRQLRFHNLLYLMAPDPAGLDPIETDQRQFEEALETARKASHAPEEKQWVHAIEVGYRRYQSEQTRLRADAATGRTPAAFRELMDAHPIHQVVDPCQSLMGVNKKAMDAAAQENLAVSRQANAAMVLLGLAGPVGGLVMGYGMARGLSRSIYRLSVHVKDLAQSLDQDVGTVSVAGGGDLQNLDREMQVIVRKVEEVAERAQRHQRELLRADQLAAVGQLAAGVAHEIRNPLTGIKMLVEAALRSRNPTPLNAEDLSVIHREVARLEQTVQEFLDFARLPAPQRCRCDLRDLITQARDLVRGRARQQSVEVGLHGLEQPAVAFVDRGQFSTVLVNLYMNAMDAMPQGGRLDVTLTAEARGAVRLTVSDTGAGIPTEMAGRLFTPFATTKPTGTGLGLSISSRILEEHGGRVSASNRPEGGACFLITLPPPPKENHADPTGH